MSSSSHWQVTDSVYTDGQSVGTRIDWQQRGGEAPAVAMDVAPAEGVPGGVMRHDNLLQIQRAWGWIPIMQPDDDVLHSMRPDDEVLHQHLETQGWRVRGRAPPRVGQLTITDMLSPAPEIKYNLYFVRMSCGRGGS